jgi:hypothetical protein
MDHLANFRERTGLLVSVRDAAEAELARAGGASVIDVKEPRRGSLGAADADAIAAVVDALADRVPVSVAAGELLDWHNTATPQFITALNAGVAFAKFGLAGCAATNDWPRRWRAAFVAIGDDIQPVAVAYADWQAARAPAPENVLNLATDSGCRALLVDTWSKSVGDVFDRWPAERVAEFAEHVRAAGIHFVLAGSLKRATLPQALSCQPALVAVRGAVCEGDRVDAISQTRVEALRAALNAQQSPAAMDKRKSSVGI